jgi:Entner-Doudoroff aldolase
MSLKENEAYFSATRVVPVLTPESVAGAVAVSRVLFDAGLRMQEITLRTEWGLQTIAALTRELPGLIVGAGSVITPGLGESAIQAGAHFLVSPGTNDALLQFAADCRVPFLPGVSTVSESMRVLALGCTAAKLFPVDLLGGVPFALRGRAFAIDEILSFRRDGRAGRTSLSAARQCYRGGRFVDGAPGADPPESIDGNPATRR